MFGSLPRFKFVYLSDFFTLHRNSCCVHLTLFQMTKILAVTKLKAFSYDKSNAAKMIISFSDREENIAGKEESACYQHFSFCHIFLKPSFVGRWKPGIVWERVNVVWYIECVDLPATWFSENEDEASYLGTIPNYPCRLFPSPFNTQSQLLRNFENIFENTKMLVSCKQHFLLLLQY